MRREAERNKVQSKDGRRSCPFCRRDKPHTHAPRPLQDTPFVKEDPEDETTAEFEQAIHDSVAATSRGNEEEDLMIERAIRASVRELQSSQSPQLTSQEALNRAIHASIAEAGRGGSDQAIRQSSTADDDAEHQALLEKAIQQSLASYQQKPQSPRVAGEVDTDEDDDFKLAIEQSKQNATLANVNDDKKLGVQKTNEKQPQVKTEEEIVLDYVKKQSLVEEEHRREMEAMAKKGEAENSSAADEEALRLAIEASMRDGASGSGS